MSPISTVLVFHEGHRVIPCFLCRSYWEERLVGVSFQLEQHDLGDLCPRCLRYTPRQNATWLREYSESLRQALADLGGSLSLKTRLPDSVDDYQSEILKVIESTARLQQMTALLRRGTRDLKNHFSRTRRLFDAFCQREGPPAGDDFNSFLKAELNRMGKVLLIGPQLLKLPEWQATVEDLMRSERESLVTKLSLEERVAEASVARRYRDFLLKSG